VTVDRTLVIVKAIRETPIGTNYARHESLFVGTGRVCTFLFPVVVLYGGRHCHGLSNCSTATTPQCSELETSTIAISSAARETSRRHGATAPWSTRSVSSPSGNYLSRHPRDGHSVECLAGLAGLAVAERRIGRQYRLCNSQPLAGIELNSQGTTLSRTVCHKRLLGGTMPSRLAAALRCGYPSVHQGTPTRYRGEYLPTACIPRFRNRSGYRCNPASSYRPLSRSQGHLKYWTLPWPVLHRDSQQDRAGKVGRGNIPQQRPCPTCSWYETLLYPPPSFTLPSGGGEPASGECPTNHGLWRGRGSGQTHGRQAATLGANRVVSSARLAAQ